MKEKWVDGVGGRGKAEEEGGRDRRERKAVEKRGRERGEKGGRRRG